MVTKSDRQPYDLDTWMPRPTASEIFWIVTGVLTFIGMVALGIWSAFNALF